MLGELPDTWVHRGNWLGEDSEKPGSRVTFQVDNHGLKRLRHWGGGGTGRADRPVNSNIRLGTKMIGGTCVLRGIRKVCVLRI